MTSTPGTSGEPGTSGTGPEGQEYRYVPPEQAPPFDPLRLCIFATVSLITWLVGPVALVVFAGLGLTGYVRARRAGLTRSRCLLRDTRLVIGYLGLLAVVGVVAVVWPLVR